MAGSLCHKSLGINTEVIKRIGCIVFKSVFPVFSAKDVPFKLAKGLQIRFLNGIAKAYNFHEYLFL